MAIESCLIVIKKKKTFPDKPKCWRPWQRARFFGCRMQPPRRLGGNLRMRVVRAPIPFHKGQQLQFKSGSLLHFLCATIEPKKMVVWKMMPWTLPCLSSHVSFRRCLSCNSRMRYDKLYPPKKKTLRWTGMASCGVYSFKPPHAYTNRKSKLRALLG